MQSSGLRVTGVGTLILQHLEQQFIAKKATDPVGRNLGFEYDGTRKFYEKRGFVEEVRIRECYQAGEDKIVYLKKLDKDAGVGDN
jgi:GNAT superfamily N-acetyltransferase